MHSQSTILQKANSPTGLQNPSAWARPNSARVRSCECQPSINSTNVVWNTFVKEFSEGRQSGERINLGLSFASFGQAKEDEKYNSHYGFIFTKASHTEEQISRAIAHELGHGAFRLWHTFSTENKYVAFQGTTTNLMDYTATSTDLYKYQWDYIHNPEFVLFRGDDEEGELLLNKEEMLSYLKQIRDANIKYSPTLAMSIKQGYNFSSSDEIELDTIKLSYLSISTFNVDTGDKNALSTIKPADKSTTATDIDNVSYTTYTFKSTKNTGLSVVSFTVKTSEKDLFEEYVYSTYIDISNQVTWVSQMDENIFGKCTGCWKSSCCRRACEYMMGNTNIANCNNAEIAKNAPNMTIEQTLCLASFSDNSKKYKIDEYNTAQLIYYKNNLEDGYNLILEELLIGNPILIGVHHKRNSGDPPNNINRATTHWMIVVSAGTINGERIVRFFDPGRDSYTNGASNENTLKYDSSKGCFSNTYRNNIWTITEIQKLK